jgi:hypothetical protein
MRHIYLHEVRFLGGSDMSFTLLVYTLGTHTVAEHRLSGVL